MPSPRPRLDERKFQFWTGFPIYETFRALFNYLEGVGAIGRMRHWRGSEMFFSNSLIIHAALTQPEHLILVRWMSLEIQ